MSLPKTGGCTEDLSPPEKASNPRWRLRKVLEESGELQEDVLDAFGIDLAQL